MLPAVCGGRNRLRLMCAPTARARPHPCGVSFRLFIVGLSKRIGLAWQEFCIVYQTYCLCEKVIHHRGRWDTTMKGERKRVERRKHERCHVQKDAFAMITPLSHKKGEIIDISRGGLAFRYEPDDNQPKLSVEIGLFLHIFLKDISFCLLRVPIKTISDFPMENGESSDLARRRSVAFHALSERQVSELEFFIENHTAC